MKEVKKTSKFYRELARLEAPPTPDREAILAMLGANIHPGEPTRKMQYEFPHNYKKGKNYDHL